jgi:hypothetical protein
MEISRDVSRILTGNLGTYRIGRHKDGSGFDISVVSDNGARQTMLGFKSRRAAEAWIADDRRGAAADVPTDPWEPSEFRMRGAPDGH